MYRAIALVRRSVFQPTPKTALTIARIVTPKGQPQWMLRGRTIGGTHEVRPRQLFRENTPSNVLRRRCAETSVDGGFDNALALYVLLGYLSKLLEQRRYRQSLHKY
jgi:hypothetical protein